MTTALASLIKFFIIAFTSIFFLVDPFAVIPAFLTMTAGEGHLARRRMARRASWTCFLTLVCFALAGSLIFRVFSITLPAFKIAGGIILLLIGIDMLQARRSATNEAPGESQEAAEKEDVGVIPLGIPMLAGPGSISTVMVLMAESGRWWQSIPVFVSIALTAVFSYWVLAGADRVRRYLGETGIRIMMRFMGLLLVAVAVQFMLSGLGDVGLVHLK
ncbi:MAG: MarC family protein [Candidatus Acidiferrales bacterium]